ncbi:MAG: ANTAR domain-containing protein [Eubacterium sp.]|nr:ANTAR domain-containing protein [Eubacterium sp.]
MPSALVISKQQETARVISDTLRTLDFSLIDTAASGTEGRRRLQETGYDIAVANTPLSDEFGVDFALDTTESYDTGVILIVKNDLLDQVEERLTDSGAFVIAKPINRQLLLQNIRFVLRAQEKIQRLTLENQKLLKKMEDQKRIFRAKLCIMAYLNISEEEAHRYIQKQAMDQRLTPRQVADRLIRMYEK